MSIFRNIRIVPTHGFRSATISWELPASEAAGEVLVAFSPSGVRGSWVERNTGAPVAGAVGFYEDDKLVINTGAEVGYYRLLLTRDNVDTFSEAVGIFHDLERHEYGIIHQSIRKEFIAMRAAHGFPVYHCIPRDIGTPNSRKDPDTGLIDGVECADIDPAAAAFDMSFQGGFFPPVLTWMRIISTQKGTFMDGANETSSTEVDVSSVRLLPWPKPLRNHMIVDPVTDRRWLVGDNVTPYDYRGIYPIAFEAEIAHLPQTDPRYRFVLPAVDLREYRKMKSWA